MFCKFIKQTILVKPNENTKHTNTAIIVLFDFPPLNFMEKYVIEGLAFVKEILKKINRIQNEIRNTGKKMK